MYVVLYKNADRIVAFAIFLDWAIAKGRNHVYLFLSMDKNDLVQEELNESSALKTF